MPRIDTATVPSRKGSGYPPPFDVPCAERTRQRLGEAGVMGTRDAEIVGEFIVEVDARVAFEEGLHSRNHFSPPGYFSLGHVSNA